MKRNYDKTNKAFIMKILLIDIEVQIGGCFTECSEVSFRRIFIQKMSESLNMPFQNKMILKMHELPRKAHMWYPITLVALSHKERLNLMALTARFIHLVPCESNIDPFRIARDAIVDLMVRELHPFHGQNS